MGCGGADAGAVVVPGYMDAGNGCCNYVGDMVCDGRCTVLKVQCVGCMQCVGVGCSWLQWLFCVNAVVVLVCVGDCSVDK